MAHGRQRPSRGMMMASDDFAHVGQPARSSGLWLPVMLALIVCATLLIQLNTYPNHDVAWILWGTREMLRGAEFGVDIIEPNPPLAWYLAVPTTIIAMQFGLPLDWTFRIAVALAAAVSAGAFARMLCRESLSRTLFLGAVSAVALLILPGREFGQREHLAVICGLPYVGLVALRVQNEVLSSRLAIPIGIVAGLGFALKPYFLAVPALVELSSQVMTRRRLRLFRQENLAIAGVILAYVFVILVSEQDYLHQSVPLANEIYWSFNRPFHSLWNSLLPRLLFIVPMAAFAIHQRDRVSTLLIAACAGFIFSFIIQHKGYSYHLLPISVLTLVILAYLVVTARALVGIATTVAMVALFAVQIVPLATWWRNNRPGGSRAVAIERYVAAIGAHAPNRKFLIVAVHPYPTYPTAIYTPAHHVSRTNSHWFLPAVVQIRSGLAKRPEAASIERHAREFILHDLSMRPDLVLIDKDSSRHTSAPGTFDLLAFFREDPKFNLVWKDYVEIEPVGNFRQFVRRKGAAK